MRLARGIVVGVAVALGALLTPALAYAAPSNGNGDDSQTITVNIPSPRATLRWAVNAESSSGAFVGGCNFLSAGLAGDNGRSAIWPEGNSLYKSRDGNVSIEKPSAAGTWELASWANHCLDRSGKAVTATSTVSYTQSEIVMTDGEVATAADGVTTIKWTGSFSVVFYGGMTYWSATDPVLTVQANGRASLQANVTGYGADRDNAGTWLVLAPAKVELATFANFPLTETGGTAMPDFLGVKASGEGVVQVAQTDDNASYWGSFPKSFLDYQARTGQGPYWYTSGGARDPAKPPLPVSVNYRDAGKTPVPPAIVTPEITQPKITSAVLEGESNNSTITQVKNLQPVFMAQPEALAAPATLFVDPGDPKSLWRANDLIPTALPVTGTDTEVWWWIATACLLLASALMATYQQKSQARRRAAAIGGVSGSGKAGRP